MYRGTMIEELIAAVERAEEHARTRQDVVVKREIFEVPLQPQFAYNDHFLAQVGAA